MGPDDSSIQLKRRIRVLLAGFIVGLIVSGITAFPLYQEMELLTHWLGVRDGANPTDYSGLIAWLITVRQGLAAVKWFFPFLFYGYDWLAFAHLVIAILFIGPFNDPVRNIWVIQWGMIACALILPLALICGPLRGIPFAWRLIDCSFGVVGIVPLFVCYRWTRKLEALAALDKR